MMESERSIQRDTLPENFNTLNEFWLFWDTHSSAEYEELMEPVEAEVDLLSSKVYYAVSKDLMARVRSEAYRQGVSTETLINLWLQEKLASVASVLHNLCSSSGTQRSGVSAPLRVGARSPRPYEPRNAIY